MCVWRLIVSSFLVLYVRVCVCLFVYNEITYPYLPSLYHLSVMYGEMSQLAVYVTQ